MLTLETLVHKLRRELKDNYQSVGDAMIAGGCTSMENYKYMLGQAHAYQSIDSAVSEILNPKEKKDEPRKDNVVSIRGFEGNTEN